MVIVGRPKVNNLRCASLGCALTRCKHVAVCRLELLNLGMIGTILALYDKLYKLYDSSGTQSGPYELLPDEEL